MSSFTIRYTIEKLQVGRALCDLGANINIVSLSMMRKQSYGEQKAARMTLTIADRTRVYMNDILVIKLTFPPDFVIIDMV